MGEIGVFERGATVDQTAYALLSDLLEIVSLSPRADGGGTGPEGSAVCRAAPADSSSPGETKLLGMTGPSRRSSSE